MPLERVDLTGKLEPLHWLVPDLLLKGYINLVASLPGNGKTLLLTALTWQMSRPEGKGAFLGERVPHGTTIYVNFDAPGQGRGIRYWLEKHRSSYPDGDMSKTIVLEPNDETYSMQEGELIELVHLAKETNAACIILDSIMSAFPAMNPSKITEVMGPFWYLRRLATETGACVVLIDHLPKPMSGETAGARGVIGSVAKPAQARAVHVLTRVPPKEVEGRNVLRWDVQKMAFSAIVEPFGIELSVEDDAVKVTQVDLPDSYGETKTGRAVRVMQSYLEERRGQNVHRKELLNTAISQANIQERAAATALRMLLGQLGDELTIEKLPGRGAPVVYRLNLEEPDDTDPTTDCMKTSNSTNPDQDGNDLMQSDIASNDKLASNNGQASPTANYGTLRLALSQDRWPSSNALDLQRLFIKAETGDIGARTAIETYLERPDVIERLSARGTVG